MLIIDRILELVTGNTRGLIRKMQFLRLLHVTANKPLSLLLLFLLAACTSEPLSTPQAQQLIREQITAHYDTLQLEGYQPLSNSDIDTIAVHHNQRGEIVGVVGELTHRYRVLQGDSLVEQSQVFNVQVNVDDIEVMPAKPLPGGQPPSIDI